MWRCGSGKILGETQGFVRYESVLTPCWYTGLLCITGPISSVRALGTTMVIINDSIPRLISWRSARPYIRVVHRYHSWGICKLFTYHKFSLAMDLKRLLQGWTWWHYDFDTVRRYLKTTSQVDAEFHGVTLGKAKHRACAGSRGSSVSLSIAAKPTVFLGSLAPVRIYASDFFMFTDIGAPFVVFLPLYF